MWSLLKAARALLSRARVLDGLGGDLRLASRRLLATPMFTAFAVASLAIGLAVTTAAYSIVATLFFAPSAIAGEDRVAMVMTPVGGKLAGGGISLPDFADLRAAQKSFDSVTASAKFYPSLSLPATTELVNGEAVDGAYFGTLGVRADVGRTIDAADVAASQPVVVLSHALWTLRFGGDPNIIGREVRIAGRPFEVVGIAPKQFEGLGRKLQGTRVWIPLSTDPRKQTSATAERDRSRVVVIGRLAPNATMTAASAELSSIGANLDSAYPRSADRNGPRRRQWLARPLAEDRPADVIMFRFGIAFVALVALVLVVACTNLSNLVLARGTERHQEFAVRRALGGSRWRLIREQCAESVLVALLGVGAAWLMFRALAAAMDVDLPITNKMFVSFAPTLDAAVGGVAGSALLLSLFVFGLEPALQLTRGGEIRGELASGGGSLVGASRSRRQRALVRWQIAISTGFFIIATMCVKYAVAEARHDSGVDLDRITVATMNFWSQQWDEDRAQRTVARVLDDIEKDPVIQHAAVATGVPFGATGTPAVAFSTTDKPITDRGEFPWGLGIAASPGFFQTMGISILRGRAFDHRDGTGTPPVVIVSERTALQLFGTNDVVGRQMLLKDVNAAAPSRSVANKLAIPGSVPPSQARSDVRTVNIIGVSENTDVGHLFSRDGEVVYTPLAQHTSRLPFAIVIVRSEASPYVALRALRESVRRADPDLAIESGGTGAGALGGPTVFLKAAAIFAVSLGALTLLLAMVGLYGVQAHGVTHRTREIGVRMSFGATAAQIRRMVLKDGYRPVVEGLSIGLFIGLVGRGLVRAFLWERIDVVDPWMVLAVPVPLVLAAFLACYWPARRASRVEPIVALRHL